MSKSILLNKNSLDISKEFIFELSLYFKDPTKETPLVSFNSEKGVLLIDGNCISETLKISLMN